LYIALANLTAPIFQVRYQFKLVTTALLSIMFLPNRTYTCQQWICLILLSIGVAIVVIGEQHNNNQKSSSSLLTTTNNPNPNVF
jgi:solute carrier family 35 (UDP-sugar transporter), member A1/2/3